MANKEIHATAGRLCCPLLLRRVIAWEPVPYFAAYLRYGVLRNNLTDRVEVRLAWLLCPSLAVLAPGIAAWRQRVSCGNPGKEHACGLARQACRER